MINYSLFFVSFTLRIRKQIILLYSRLSLSVIWLANAVVPLCKRFRDRECGFQHIFGWKVNILVYFKHKNSFLISQLHLESVLIR